MLSTWYVLATMYSPNLCDAYRKLKFSEKEYHVHQIQVSAYNLFNLSSYEHHILSRLLITHLQAEGSLHSVKYDGN